MKIAHTSTPSDKPLLTTAPSWRILESTDNLSRAAVALNQQHLAIARMVVPDPQACVSDVASRLGVRLGIAEHRALAYVAIGFMLHNFPRLAANLGQGHFSFDHVRPLADSLECLPLEFHEAVETDLLIVLSPRRPNQATPSVRRVGRLARDIIEDHHPPARPRDPDDKPKPQPHDRQLSWDERGEETTDFFLTLDKASSEEIIQLVKSVAAKENCSRADALMRLLRGQSTAEISLNLYSPINGKRIWAAGQWLDEERSSEWFARVTHTVTPGWARCEGYQPTPLIRASVMGRDGHCRFPGCDVPAERCDLDHVRRWDDGGGESETSTDNLHCLCRKHHRLKTAGQWDVALHRDGTEIWTSHGDGHVVVTEPGGVLGRETFEKRAIRRGKLLAQYNLGRLDTDTDFPF